MEDYNWISAKSIVTGKLIKVRQTKSCSNFWIDKENNQYTTEALDFTQAQEKPDFMKSFEENNRRYAEQQEEYQKELGKILSSMDANAIADHKAKIDEREYWRKLRGDVFLSLLNTQMLTTNDELEDVLGKTDAVIRALYGQDVDFFKDK